MYRIKEKQFFYPLCPSLFAFELSIKAIQLFLKRHAENGDACAAQDFLGG
jgi:hypothetical protein